MKPKNIRPRIKILVIYKTKEGEWRGFCSPYDVSCNATTEKAVLKSLKELVSLYEEGLERYGYPKHLSIKQLSDSEDEKIFKKVLEIIAENEKEKLTKKYYDYQEQYDDHVQIRSRHDNLSGFYYHQSSQVA